MYFSALVLPISRLASSHGRLYRVTHGTFQDYCRERWGIKRQRAYELMEAARIVSNLSEISDILPAFHLARVRVALQTWGNTLSPHVPLSPLATAPGLSVRDSRPSTK